MADLLIISPSPTHPVTAGNRARIYNMMNYFLSKNISIFYVFVGMEPGDNEAMKKFFNGNFLYVDPSPQPLQKYSFLKKVRNKIESLFPKPKGKLNIDEWYIPHLNEVIFELFRKYEFKAMLVEYVYMSKAFECVNKNVLKILDTHDIMTNRDEKYLNAGLKPTWFFTNAKQEKKGLDRADVIIAINQNEASFFRNLSRKKVVVNGHSTTPSIPYSNKERNKILFFASGNDINIHAIQYFLDKIFPLLLKLRPEVKLILAGSICNSIKNIQPEIEFRGYIDDVEKLYNEIDLVINPIQFGTGLKIKNTEALAFSKPLITTSIGAEGLESAVNKAFIVRDNPAEFAHTINEVLANNEMYSNLQQEAYEFALNYHNQSYIELDKLIQHIKRN